jgi:hypothetical protein
MKGRRRCGGLQLSARVRTVKSIFLFYLISTSWCSACVRVGQDSGSADCRMPLCAQSGVGAVFRGGWCAGGGAVSGKCADVVTRKRIQVSKEWRVAMSRGVVRSVESRWSGGLWASRRLFAAGGLAQRTTGVWLIPDGRALQLQVHFTACRLTVNSGDRPGSAEYPAGSGCPYGIAGTITGPARMMPRRARQGSLDR